MKFKNFITGKTAESLLETLKKYNATILNTFNDNSKLSEESLREWCTGSVKFAEDFCSDFMMTEDEFVQFCDDVKDKSFEISEIYEKEMN